MWPAKLWNLLRSNKTSSDIDRELAFHLAEREDELVAGGMDLTSARHAALRQFGNYAIQKEDTRQREVLVWLDTVFADLRQALRMLRRSPGFALVAIVSLALGIGGNTAIFTLINTAMLKSLPVDHPEELLQLTRNGEGSVTHALWEQIREGSRVPADLTAYAATGMDLSNGGETRPTTLALVSGNFFSVLGVYPTVGRLLTEADDQPGCPAVAVISTAFWRSEYSGSSDVLSKSVSLDGHPFRIVGVTDRSFFGIEFGDDMPVWAPLCSEAIVRGPASGNDSRMGRLVIVRPHAGATLNQIDARLKALTPSLLEATRQFPGSSKGVKQGAQQYRQTTLGAEPFAKGIPGLSSQYGKALLVLMTIVGVVLLIACSNVANLLLARATARQHEVAVRLALGAGRMRLVRQLLTESLLLSLLGATLGLLFANWGSRALVGFLGPRISLDLAPDARVLTFTIAVATLTGLLFGLAPAWRAARADPHAAMKPSARGVVEGHSRFGAGRALVTGQIALSLVMVTGAGLLLGSWRRLATFDAGFERDRALLVTANTRAAQIPPAARSLTFQRVAERLNTLPGVDTVSAAVRTPIGHVNWNTVIRTEESPAAPDDAPVVQMNEVSAGYFASIGSTLIAGRDFGSSEVRGSPDVVIVSEALARRFFGSTTGALNRIVRFGRQPGPPFRIVGIAADFKQTQLREPDPPIVYFSLSQDPEPAPGITFTLRTQGSPDALVPTARAALTEFDARYSLRFITLEEQVSNSIRLPRTLGLLSGFFGALALLLAAIGLYGIISYSVARRRNEIGVRIALGAARGRIVSMVFRDAALIVALGLAGGLIVSLAVTRTVSGFLYGIEPNDPTTFLLSALTLVATALAAALLPAWRVARLDPVSALREE